MGYRTYFKARLTQNLLAFMKLNSSTIVPLENNWKRYEVF